MILQASQPDRKLVRQIPEFLELRGGTVRKYLEDIRPRLKRLKQKPTAAFYRHAERWGGEGSRAAEPIKDERSRAKCQCKYRQIQTSDGVWEAYQNCDTGREFAKASARLA